MALELTTIQPIKIDGVECRPVVNAESRLRIAEIQTIVSDEDRKKAIEVFASIFPDNTEYVKGKLEQMTALDLELIQTYILAGQKGVDTVLDGLKEAMQK